MMNMKKLLALLLAIVLVMGMFPMGALADETEPELCTCGLVLNHDGECQSQEPAPQNLEEPELCTCGLEKGHEGECKTAEPEYCDCGLTKGHEGECKTAEPEYCDCGLTKGHEGDCKTAEPEYCDCGLTKGHDGECQKTEPEKCALCESTEHATNLCTLFCGFCQKVPCECVACEKCSVKNGHTDQCELKPCETCGKNPCECEVKETTEAVEVCEYCGVELIEDAEHAEDCLSLCTCDPKPEEGEAHKEECPLYVEEILDSIEYSGTTSSGISATVIASGVAFPAGTEMTVADTSVDMGVINAVVNGATKFMLRKSAPASNVEILGAKAVDISFGGEQPSEPVSLTITVPADEVPSGANQAIIVHFGENGPEKVASQYLVTNVDVHSFSVEVDGFSSYVAVFVNGKYDAKLMSDVLAGNSRYSIETFPVDIFDYDPVTINNALNAVPADGKGFHFTGYGVEGCTSNSGINNSAAGFAKQGILANELVNGLPDINYIGNTNAGKDGGIESGKVLFSATEYTSAKTIYNDIPFEFIFDNETGFYTYKSSANHAQINDAENRVVLYADTLSTQNQYVATLTPVTTGSSDYKNIQIDGNSLTATANASSGDANRMDAYVVFKAPTDTNGKGTVSTSDVGFIYVKAKVPASVGSNKFQVFIATSTVASYNETNTKIVPYTANGDWIEFLIDTSEIPGWAGATLNSLRIDLFDSNKVANGSSIDINKDYPVEIKQVSLIEKNVDVHATRGGYYPFSDIRKSYPGNNDNFTMSAWEDLFLSRDNVTARASRSINNPTPAQASDMYGQLAYGTVMEFDFYIPVDKSGEDLTYFFDGDDDLWVFVDGKLALDIGGGHGAITGSLNFSTGEVSVASAQKVTGYNSGISGETGTVSNGKMDVSQYSPGKHTMKVFYLERGGSVSNCFMKFNLPQTPEGDVTISKRLELINNDESSIDAEIKQSEKFEFTVQVQNMLAGGDEKPHVYSGSYVLMDATGKGHNKNTTDGKILLAHGETAFIAEIAEGSDVTVTESDHAIAGYSNPIVKVNGTTAKTAKLTTGNDTDIDFAFVNQYTEDTVQYTYIPVNPTNCPEDQKGTVKLTGDDTTKTAVVTGVTETVGKRVGTPSGSTAEGSNAVKFVGWYSDAACKQLISENQEYVPARAQGEKLLAGGTVYAKFEFLYGNLTIDKKGIQTVDNDSDEKQSTIYEISGTSSNGTSVYLEVVIVGNSSVTVKDLPVGDYTVKEKTTWSWRYTPNANLKSATIRGNETTKVEFENNRNKLLWLSGDSYCENWWGGENGTKVVERNAANGIVTSTN